VNPDRTTFSFTRPGDETVYYVDVASDWRLLRNLRYIGSVDNKIANQEIFRLNAREYRRTTQLHEQPLK
jgi:hypothetical protein